MDRSKWLTRSYSMICINDWAKRKGRGPSNYQTSSGHTTAPHRPPQAKPPFQLAFGINAMILVEVGKARKKKEDDKFTTNPLKIQQALDNGAYRLENQDETPIFEDVECHTP
ncbi:hypothetical protein CR513_07107, partial [Mucuna pruriens]